MLKTSQLSQVAQPIPEDVETFTITSGKNILVIREPLALDYLLAEEEAGTNPNIHERCFTLASRLAVSWNGEKGVTAVDIGKLNRVAYKRLLDLVSGFFLDIMPSIGDEFIKAALEKAEKNK